MCIGESVAVLATEAIVMRRTELSKFRFAVMAAVGAAMLTAPCGFAQTQDAQPSVADAARAAAAAKKDKAASVSKAVITDDSLGSGSRVAAKGGSGASAAAAAAATAADSPDKFKSLDEAWGKLQATEVALARLNPLDKSQMANLVLQGNAADFPGRADWEEKLFVAKTSYVERSEGLILATRQLLTEIADLQKEGPIPSNDPRFVALAKRSKQLAQLTARTETDFQAVLNEGKNAAK